MCQHRAATEGCQMRIVCRWNDTDTPRATAEEVAEPVYKGGRWHPSPDW